MRCYGNVTGQCGRVLVNQYARHATGTGYAFVGRRSMPSLALYKLSGGISVGWVPAAWRVQCLVWVSSGDEYGTIHGAVVMLVAVI